MVVQRFLLFIFLGFTVGTLVLEAASPVPTTQELVKLYITQHPYLNLQGKPVIGFYNRGEPYYEFTNFWEKHPIALDGKTWPTSEHYFQAQKFNAYPAIQDQIRMTQNPRAIFDLTNSKTGTYKGNIRSDWFKKDHTGNTPGDYAMFKAVQAKFTQHDYLKKLLLSTGDAYLIEASPYDDEWGTGINGSGKNKLGQILMQVRSELRKPAAAPVYAYPTSPTGGLPAYPPVAPTPAGLPMYPTASPLPATPPPVVPIPGLPAYPTGPAPLPAAYPASPIGLPAYPPVYPYPTTSPLPATPPPVGTTPIPGLPVNPPPSGLPMYPSVEAKR